MSVNMAAFVILFSLPALHLCQPVDTVPLKTELNVQKINFTNMKKTFFIFHITDANWHRADRVCTINNMRLASVNNQEENDQLVNLMKKHEINNIWIGGTDLGEEGRFYWVSSGASLGFSAWNNGEPNNINGGEHCLELKTSGRWNDVPCHWQLHFACEGYVPV